MNKKFCSKCKKEVIPLSVKTMTLFGEVLSQQVCPRCSQVLFSELLEKILLPERKPETVKGLYIAFEGIDGCGKTYHSQIVVKKLKGKGLDAIYVKEPYINAIKEFIHRTEEEVDPDAEAYIFAADRIILQKTIVLPALSQGRTVITDRSVYASLAYQSARGLPELFILSINRSIKFPDKVILLDISPNEALRRIRNSGRKFTRFENKNFAEKVRDLYLQIANRERNKFFVIDATLRMEEVEERVWEIIEKILSA